MRTWRAVLALVVVVLVARSSSAAPGKITGVRNLATVSRLTGTPSLNNTTSPYNIGGTDLGFPIYHNSRMYLLFGDTFSGEDPDGGGWRRNTIAWSSDTTLSDGIVFDGWATSPTTGEAKTTFASNAPSGGIVGNIPTGGIDVNGTMYAWFMNVTQWGPAGGEWYISQAELGKWDDSTASFSLVPDSIFAGNGNFGMVAAREGVNGDAYIYLWGTPGGRFGRVKLARFLPSQIETRSAYQFFNGTVNGVAQWTSDEFEGDFVITSQVGEMSVMYNQALKAWTIMYFNEINDRVEIRQSDTPWGPWSAPVIVQTFSQGPAGTFGLYAPYMHPLWVENNGATLYFTMSYWVPYDVYLTKVTLDIAAAPVGSVTINSGAAYTGSRTATLSLPATDDSGTVYQMRISNDGVFDTEGWQSYAAARSWTLTSGQGMKTVYVRFRDTLNIESDTVVDSIVVDTAAPTISSVSLSNSRAAAGDSVHVTVNATDAIGVTSVTANGLALAHTGTSTWEGDISALAGLGSHSVTVVASDGAGRTATNASANYTTALVFGVGVTGLSNPSMSAAATRWLFKAWGKVTTQGPNAFDLTDGSGAVVRINAPGYSGIADGDYASARGILTPGATPTLTAQPVDVKRLNN